VAKPKKRYSKEFKLEAVKLIKQQGLTYRQVATDLGINATQLTRWVPEFQASGELGAFPGSGKLSPEQEHVRQLEEQVRRLTIDLAAWTTLFRPTSLKSMRCGSRAF
jgi:transposase